MHFSRAAGNLEKCSTLKSAAAFISSFSSAPLSRGKKLCFHLSPSRADCKTHFKRQNEVMNFLKSPPSLNSRDSARSPTLFSSLHFVDFSLSICTRLESKICASTFGLPAKLKSQKANKNKREKNL